MPSPTKTEFSELLPKLNEIDEKNEKAINALQQQVTELKGKTRQCGQSRSLMLSTTQSKSKHGYHDHASHDEQITFPHKSLMGGIQGQASGPYSSVDSQVNPSGNGNVPSSGNPGFSSIQTDELKVEYRAIADTYSRLRLPGDMRYNGSRVEVKQSCKDATYALTTLARYLETCLKIAS